jgi:tetratricopeptide (TPR) repeat protein
VKRQVLALAVLALVALPSCAYYNTYYLAKKNYDKATNGQPYVVDPTTGTQSQQSYTDAIKYSKKLLSQYPKSKWVDDAYLLWALSLMGRDDPLETSNMLEGFSVRYPNSPIRSDVTFFLGVAYRRAHKPTDALRAFDEFLAKYPRHKYVTYAQLERSHALLALDRRAEAAAAATKVIERDPKGPLVTAARQARSDALFADGQFGPARDDYRALGFDATDDEQRFGYLLREADCLEGARQYDAEIDLLKSTLSHERAPVVSTQTTANGTAVMNAPTGPGADHWGRLRIRIGATHLLAGRLDQALQEYGQVIAGYPRTVLAAEAQYRVGYAYETQGEDFARARLEYGKVKDQTQMGGFAQMASTRIANLDRLANFKGATGSDSLDRKAEARFMLAELYLFQHDRPERALEEYRTIETDYHGTPWGGKALNAQAWVLRRKLDRPREADSLLWLVVHDYRATDAQLAARDYLEGEGVEVPDTMIERPKVEIAPELLAADTLHLTAPPDSVPRLGAAPGVGLAGAPGAPGALASPAGIAPLGAAGAGAAASRQPGGIIYSEPIVRDSTRAPGPPSAGTASAAAAHGPQGAPDSLGTHAPADTVHTSAPADTARTSAPADTTGKHP